MSVESHYKQLANSLIVSYTRGLLSLARKKRSRKIAVTSEADSRVINSLKRITQDIQRYADPFSLEKALDSIDLAKIYDGVDKRELECQTTELGYEDFVVLETLRYFKEDFFTWVTKPQCPKCGGDGANVIPAGSARPPLLNPDEISIIEMYNCVNCSERVEFPRINNPAKLLETRKGRCGEWVNCFMLILRAVLGTDVQTRYIWNAEDHVWCEYYSSKQRKWVHLDPCENVSDEPSLYSKNWGKMMSWVVGIGENYVVDLSEKYVTEVSKRLDKSTVANEQTIANFIEQYNAHLLLQTWEKLQQLEVTENEKYLMLYNDVLLPQARERVNFQRKPTTSSNLPQGRQTGDASWTSARGENG
ncbi:hypothetical protein OXX80_004257 [Metschnikowia pulcherrima]